MLSIQYIGSTGTATPRESLGLERVFEVPDLTRFKPRKGATDSVKPRSSATNKGKPTEKNFQIILPTMLRLRYADSAAAFGANNVFAVEALPHGAVWVAADPLSAVDRLQAAALLRDVEDVAAFGPCGRNIRGKLWLLRKQGH